MRGAVWKLDYLYAAIVRNSSTKHLNNAVKKYQNLLKFNHKRLRNHSFFSKGSQSFFYALGKEAVRQIHPSFPPASVDKDEEMKR